MSLVFDAIYDFKEWRKKFNISRIALPLYGTRTRNYSSVITLTFLKFYAQKKYKQLRVIMVTTITLLVFTVNYE